MRCNEMKDRSEGLVDEEVFVWNDTKKERFHLLLMLLLYLGLFVMILLSSRERRLFGIRIARG